MSVINPDPASNWSLATALSEHDRQLISATLEIAYEAIRDSGVEATVEEVERALTGRDPEQPFRPAARLD
jgi:alpha-D-ribose 1-methylphosphonate 5-triphosphate diphosphatase PhnM